MNSNFGSAPPPAHQGIRSTLKSHPTIAPQLPPTRPKGVSPLHLNLKPVSDSKLSWDYLPVRDIEKKRNNEITNSRIHEFKVLHKGHRAF